MIMIFSLLKSTSLAMQHLVTVVYIVHILDTRVQFLLPYQARVETGSQSGDPLTHWFIW